MSNTEETVLKARNIREVIKNFNHIQPIDKKRKLFYVDFYKDNLEDLRIKLENIDLFMPGKTFYITGQRGTGKTSALFQLPNKQLEEMFDFVYLTFYKDVDIADIDIVDVLFNIGQILTTKEKKLAKKFDDRLKELNDLYQGTKEIIKEKSKEREISFSGKLWIKFLANSDFRQKVREYIHPNIDDFLDIVNDIVLEYNSIKKAQGKRLILILDDLEKMTDIDQIRKLFIDSHQYLVKIRVPKVISFPVNLQSIDSRINVNPDSDVYTFATSGVIENSKISSVEVNNNRKLFEEIVYKRIENKNLISYDAINLAIDYSGGNIRQFVKIIQTGAFNALKDKDANIMQKHIEQAIERERLQLSYSVVGRKVDILKYVKKYNSLPKDINEDVINCILGNLILIFSDHDAWYDVNPLIKQTIE